MMCTWIRWQLQSALDEGGTRPPRCERHLARCASCSAYAVRLESLHTQLTVGAPHASMPAREARQASPRRLWLAAPLAACAAALYLIFTPARPTATHEPAPAAPAVATAKPIAVPAAMVGKHALDLLDAAPLRNELSALIADGERGTRAVLGAAGVGRVFERRPRGD